MNSVRVGDASVSAVYEPASSGADAAVFVCAHGAGGNMNDRGLSATARAMREEGLGVVRFNFLYTEQKKGRPDPMPVCMSVIRAVVDQVRAELSPRKLVIGGRSMGGRAASMLAAEGFDASGLLLLAYPLHPAGQPEKLRTAHLPDIAMPVLSFSGTRDALCTRSLMDDALATVKAPWEQVWIESADHSFHVLKSSGQTDAGVLASMALRARSWVDSLQS